jgi:hypothetical protein
MQTDQSSLSHIDFDELRERVREALPINEVFDYDGVPLKKAGKGKWMALCPFHGEKTASMIVGGSPPDRAHCMGCGWDGDIFAFWQERRGVDFPQAIKDLAAVAGIPLPSGEWKRPARGAPVKRQEMRLDEGEQIKPDLPSLRHLRAPEIEQLAQVRGVSVDAVKLAAFTFKRIGAVDAWPLYRGHEGAWLPRSNGAWPSWVITDHTRAVAEFRRLDNEKYPKGDGSGIKAWSTRGKNWLLGAADMGNRACVLLVEGGPDLLAAYHFLLRFRKVDKVAVVCMLGASNRIREEALPNFEGKRVCILADADVLKDDANPRKRVLPGVEAAFRWQEQLQAAGAAVRTFNLGPIYNAAHFAEWAAGTRLAADVGIDTPGFTRADGVPVKDLNDLVLCGPSVTDDPWVRDAFCDWEF